MDARQRLEIGRLYARYAGQMRLFARQALDNDALAEEAVQESFRIACEKPEEVCGSPNAGGWLINTLKFVIQNTRKIRNRAENLMAELQSRHGLEEWAEDPLDPDLAFGSLARTEEYKLLKGFTLEKKSILELALERGITVSACKKRLQRARDFLRQELSDENL